MGKNLSQGVRTKPKQVEKSAKEINEVFKEARTNKGLTREKAYMELHIHPSRIERIENGMPPTPEELVDMVKVYKEPKLINYYCRNVCEIGKKYLKDVEEKNLSEIVLSVLDSLSDLDREKERLVEIAKDGKVANEEIMDFKKIKKDLDEMAEIVNSLQLWVKQMNIE